MDIEELMIVIEKSRKSIQPVEETIFEEIRDRIRELEELKKTTEKDEEIQRIDDEYRTLKRIQRRLFEERVGKIIRAAWAEVCGTVSGIEGLENLLECEKIFYNQLVNLITSFRDEIFGLSSSAASSTSSLKTHESKFEEIGEGFVVVRVKGDVEFEGVDGKTYKLKKEDVVALPLLNAKALVKGDLAEIVEINR